MKTLALNARYSPSFILYSILLFYAVSPANQWQHYTAIVICWKSWRKLLGYEYWIGGVLVTPYTQLGAFLE